MGFKVTPAAGPLRSFEAERLAAPGHPGQQLAGCGFGLQGFNHSLNGLGFRGFRV